MLEYNYGTAMNTLIEYYEEMLELIVQARLASDRVDEWKKVLDLVTNTDQTKYIEKLYHHAFVARTNFLGEE